MSQSSIPRQHSLRALPVGIANQMNCVGCEACAKICPKKCYTHAPMPAEAG